MDYKIDWLTLTLKPEKDNVKFSELKCTDDLHPLENWLFHFLELVKIKSDFHLKTGSVQHYNYMYTYNGISIAFANNLHFAEQGLMIRFSAEGISYYEKYRKASYSEWNWITFLKEFFSLGVYGLKCRCTRIDLAFDDISYDEKQLISIDKIKKAVKRGEAVSLFRSVDPLGKNKLIHEITHIEDYNTKGELLGETIEFGNRKSPVFLRFYDKLKEQLKKHKPVDDKIKHWVRMEFEFKQVRAMAICDSLILLSSEEFGKYFSQVVNRYVRFVKPEGDRKHYYRCKSRKWWSDIVGTVEKAKLIENKAVKNRYNSSMRWLQRTVYPTLWAILNCQNIDEFLTNVREIGCEAQNNKHHEIIKDFVSNKAEENYIGIDIHKASTDCFIQLVKELEETAYSNKMKRAGYDLCQILELEDEYKRFHNVKVTGMVDKNINEYRNRKMTISDELKAIDDVFGAFDE